MKKLFSILAITALVLAGTTNLKATNAQTMPTSLQTLTSATTVSLVEDEEAASSSEGETWVPSRIKTTIY